jgi:uncharacterized protein YndB with AHSA1/START domain
MSDFVARVAMLIRKPVAQVFEAFVNPALTTMFWFSKSNGKLEPGRRVRWDWENYGVSVNVDVKAVEPNQRILIEWSSNDEPATSVEWKFTARPDDTTFVEIANSGFSGTPEEQAKRAIDSTEGFAFVVASLKALLEHDMKLDLVADRFPDGLKQ